MCDARRRIYYMWCPFILGFLTAEWALCGVGSLLDVIKIVVWQILLNLYLHSLLFNISCFSIKNFGKRKKEKYNKGFNCNGYNLPLSSTGCYTIRKIPQIPLLELYPSSFRSIISSLKSQIPNFLIINHSLIWQDKTRYS